MAVVSPASRLVEDLNEEVVGIAQDRDVSGPDTHRLAFRGYDQESGVFQSRKHGIDTAHEQAKHARAGIVNSGDSLLPGSPGFHELHFKIRPRDFRCIAPRLES